ncbi:MAG: class I SAM-dependent DNA methyltransferase [Flavobacteriales bacterium]|nr:class I SAM-dependent DNA methyltransferase [Flavobacteriales bacterium]
MEKSQIQSESIADIKAAERLARLYDIIVQDNDIKDEADRHRLNIFLSRLLFCFFAEDTGIFANDQFTNAVASHTTEDGSDLQTYLQKLFAVLNLSERTDTPQYLKAFPYVNGGLFAEESPVPQFSRKARKIIIECGSLNWKAINPDIFGSMIQAVVHNDQRGSLGMHYTSLVNIMKVIAPLFLNDLQEQLEKTGDDPKKLNKLLGRLYQLRIFDPACGSGNFLIIAYKELCKLEIEILKQLDKGQTSFKDFSHIRLSQFYGIEIDDFACQTAKLSLWLADHQMNQAFREVFGDAKPTLPLQEGGQIVCGNATRLDWEEVCPKEDEAEIYILGNPPYLGSSMQSKKQKADMVTVFDGIKGYKNLDYIACWFLVGARYIQDSIAQLAFVSTNSISQGEQVAMLWPHIFSMNLEIGFAHQSFKWTNNAKGNAGVTCIVVGIRNPSEKPKYLFKDGISHVVKNINPYLSNSKNIVIDKRSYSLATIPTMSYGNKAADGGHLSLTEHERDEILTTTPEAKQFIKKLTGSAEFINDKRRYCIWIENNELEQAKSIVEIDKQIEKVRQFRLNSKKKATREDASVAHRFAEARYSEKSSIIIPRVSSERRQYIPIGFLESDTIILDSAQAIYDPETYIFAIISSRIHMTWVRAVAGRLKTDYRYSSALCYNTFPFPDISEAQKTSLEDHVFKVLDEREQHSEKTLAQLYDPDKMPDGLRQAHHEMDLAVEQCYRQKPFESDEQRLEYLFKLYEQMIAAEKVKK